MNAVHTTMLLLFVVAATLAEGSSTYSLGNFFRRIGKHPDNYHRSQMRDGLDFGYVNGTDTTTFASLPYKADGSCFSDGFGLGSDDECAYIAGEGILSGLTTSPTVRYTFPADFSEVSFTAKFQRMGDEGDGNTVVLSLSRKDGAVEQLSTQVVATPTLTTQAVSVGSVKAGDTLDWIVSSGGTDVAYDLVTVETFKVQVPCSVACTHDSCDQAYSMACLSPDDQAKAAARRCDNAEQKCDKLDASCKTSINNCGKGTTEAEECKGRIQSTCQTMVAVCKGNVKTCREMLTQPSTCEGTASDRKEDL